MIDININAIISQALAAAVQQAIQPLQQEYANKMAEMAQQIAALEAQSANRHERLRVLEGALTDRVAALENNPAQGVDTTLEKRIAALETNTADTIGEIDTIKQQLVVLDQHGGLLEYLDNQEWFWNKIRNFTDTAVEQAIENHTDMYDHSDFVTEDKLDDYVQKDSFRDEIEDVLNNATIRIRF